MAAAACSASTTSRAPSGAPAEARGPAGIRAIDHVIIVVQENRSFDHYFGTFPGAAGLPRKHGRISVCIPDPKLDRCSRPYHDTNFYDQGAGHNHRASVVDVNGGKMNGFVVNFRRAKHHYCDKHRGDRDCQRTNVGPRKQPDVMGYHTAAEIPNYWAYARHFVLQDRMFAPGGLLDAAVAPVPGLGMGGHLPGAQGPDELPVGARFRYPAMDEGEDPPLRVDRHHVSAAQGRRQLGVLRREELVHHPAVRAPTGGVHARDAQSLAGLPHGGPERSARQHPRARGLLRSRGQRHASVRLVGHGRKRRLRAPARFDHGSVRRGQRGSSTPRCRDRIGGAPRSG